MKKYLILLMVLVGAGLVSAALLPNEICFDIYGGGEFCFLNHTINHSLSVVGDLTANTFYGAWNSSGDYYLKSNPFSFYNSTDFSIADYRLLTNHTFNGDVGIVGDLTQQGNTFTLGDGSAGDPQIVFNSGNDGYIQWLEDQEVFSLRTGGASYVAPLGEISGLAINAKRTTSNFAGGFTSWVESTASSGSYYGFWGGYYDSGASAPSQSDVYGVVGYNNFAGTNERTIGSSFGGFFANSPDYGSLITITDAYGIYANAVLGGGTAPTTYGVYIENPDSTTTTNYGLYIAPMTAGDTDWAIYSTGGDSYHAGDIILEDTINKDVSIGSDNTGYLDLKASTGIRVNNDLKINGELNVTEDANFVKNITLSDPVGEIQFADPSHSKIGIPDPLFPEYFAFVNDYTDFWLGVSGDERLYLNYYNGYDVMVGFSGWNQVNLTVSESVRVEDGDYVHDGKTGFTGSCVNVTYSGGIAVGCND